MIRMKREEILEAESRHILMKGIIGEHNSVTIGQGLREDIKEKELHQGIGPMTGENIEENTVTEDTRKEIITTAEIAVIDTKPTEEKRNPRKQRRSRRNVKKEKLKN